MAHVDWQRRYEVAIEAATTAGKVALEYFDRPIDVEWKSNQSPVTVADRTAEERLRRILLGEFPNDGFLGEEFGEKPGSSGYRWIIDPIDGTRSFVRGIPLWGTLVGLEYQGDQIAGVVSIPALGQTYRALRGEGAFRNDRSIRVSTVDRFADSHVFYSGVGWFMAGSAREAFLDLVSRTERQRGFGDFYGFMLVAQGSGEVMFDYGVHLWDVAAIKPIIEEAGGRFSDWGGNATIERPDALATNAVLHDEVLRLLRNKLPPSFRPENVENEGMIT